MAHSAPYSQLNGPFICLRGHPALCRTPVAHGRPAGAAPRLRLASGVMLTQFAGLGSYASDLLVHERALVKIDADMPLDRAALLGCGVTTGLGAVFNTAAVPPGRRSPSSAAAASG